MKRGLTLLLAALVGWLASGFYIVQGNEKAVVRRCGRLVRSESGNARLVGSGLHYDLPWPFSQVDRINLSEVRTLTIGTTETAEVSGNMGEFLRSATALNQSQFLTGDKNILNLQITVQYRISERNPEDYLFGSESPERHLRSLVESAAADLISRSGVDYVHPLGLAELRGLLTERTRQLAEQYRLGIDVEEAAPTAVYPPPQVKQAFLDVSDARAAREQYIHTALAYAEQLRSKAEAEAWQIENEAQTDRQKRIEEARGSADRFRKIVAELERQEQSGVQSRAAARKMALRRMYLEAMEDILRNVEGKVYLDSGDEVDLTIFRDPKR